MKSDGRNIRRLFPELDSMANQVWAEAACGVWADVLERSEWQNAEEAQFGISTPGITLIKHTKAVLAHSLAIAETMKNLHKTDMPIDLDVLTAACVLHDVDKLLALAPDGKGGCKPTEIGYTYQHGFYSAFYAEKANLPPEIVTLIIDHTALSRMMPPSIEGVILYFADMSDAEVVKFAYGYTPTVLTAIGKMPNKK